MSDTGNIQRTFTLDEIEATLRDRIADAESVVALTAHVKQQLWRKYYSVFLSTREYDPESHSWQPPLPTEGMELQRRFDEICVRQYRAEERLSYIRAEHTKLMALLPMYARLMRETSTVEVIATI